MAILFTCPHCGNQASTTDDLAGQTVPCAGCGQAVTIPALSPAPAGDAAEAMSAPRLRASPDNPYSAPVEGPAEPPSGRGCGCGTIAVVLLLGMLLVALMLPAVEGAREAARRTQCQNNLRNIALGLQNYHDTYKTFPMGAMHAGLTGDSARIGPSWWFGILPYCEQRNIYAKIETLQQPGAPGNGAFNAQNLNTHIPGSLLNALVPDPGWDAQGTGPRVASTIVGGGFLSGSAASLPVPPAKARQPAGPPPLYDCYNITTVRYPPHFKRVLGASARPGCSEDHGINNPLQSPHPGGLLTAMADGSAQFISGTADLAVLLRLAIRDDGQTVELD